MPVMISDNRKITLIFLKFGYEFHTIVIEVILGVSYIYRGLQRSREGIMQILRVELLLSRTLL